MMKTKTDIANVVRALIRDDAGRVLLMRRADFLPGYWEVPGGGVDEEEDHTEALVREMREEAGVKIIVGKRIHEDNRTLPSGRRMRTFTYEATISEGEVVVDPLEHDAAGWYFDSHLPQKITEIASVILTGEEITLPASAFTSQD